MADPLTPQIGWPHILRVAAWQTASLGLLESGSPAVFMPTTTKAVALTDGLRKAVDGEVNWLRNNMRSPKHVDADAFAIDSYFRRVLSKLACQRDQVDSCSQATLFLDALEKAFQSAPCFSCQLARKPAPYVCRWVDASELADLQTQNSGGKCLEPINDLFDWAVEIAETAYRDAGQTVPVQDLQLSTAHGSPNVKLHSAVNATTHDADDALTRSVKLQLHVDSLALNDFATLPYVLVHECLIHGFCGVNIASADAADSVGFHDGTMDCVAHAVLKKRFASTGKGLGAFGSAYQQRMDCVRVYRYDYSAGQSADTAQWLLGALAYRIMHSFFGAALMGKRRKVERIAGPTAESLTIGALLWLNACPTFTHQQRGEFTASMAHFARLSAAEEAALVLESPLLAAFRDHVNHFDALALAKRVCGNA